MTKQISKKQSAVKRMFNWFRRHRVTAAFAALSTALAMYLVGSWAILQIQIHFERERFYAVQNNEASLYVQIKNVLGASNKVATISKCSYTSVEVGRGTRSCDINLFFKYPASNAKAAYLLSENIAKVIRSSQIVTAYRQYNISDLYDAANQNHLKSDAFKFIDNNLGCGGDYWFNDGTKVIEGFPANFSHDTGLYIQLNCSAKAKAGYFLVTED